VQTPQPVSSRGGVVAGPNALTAEAGLRALAAGGHAADAALAMAAMSAVTMPQMCGLGGDAFVLVAEPGSAVVSVNGSGPAPEAATVERFRTKGHEQMPFTGWWSVAVPGAAGAYLALHERYGRLPLPGLWAPAVEKARGGFAIDARLSGDIAAGAELLRRDPAAAAVHLAAGVAPRPGTMMRNPDLAAALEEVALHGDTVSDGRLARLVGDAADAAGALLSAGDLRQAPPAVGPPLSVNYGDAVVFSNPLPSQGVILLEMLSLLDGFDITAQDLLSAEVLHLLIEVKKLAYADRNALLGDPAFVDVPAERLLSPSFAAARRRDLPASASPAAPGLGGDTTSFVAVDRDGNAVSFIHSISALWGSGVMAPGTGFLLNNRAGRSFVLDASHPNCLMPGKLPMHTLHAYVARDRSSGELLVAGNTPGGDGQPQWNLQVLVHLLHGGVDLAEAVHAPRWTSVPGTDPISLASPPRVVLESRFPAATVDGLRVLGHEVSVVRPYAAGGSVMLARVTPEGLLQAAADARDGGQALAL
jgi:gamma-glutamyltranspeptidase/glutathione hydrolase